MKLASHNSLSFIKPDTWYERILNFTSKCQSLDIQSQYEYGVRLFDIRVRRDWISCTTSEYDACGAHGIINYKNLCIGDVLQYLDCKSTKEDPVYVQLNLENLKSDEDRDYVWFKDLFKKCVKIYPDIIFCGGYVKHPWHKLIDCVDPSIEQKNWEFMSFTWQPTKWEKIKCFFSNLLHFSPKYWAKKDNKKYKSDGTSADFLMLDFVQYGDI